MRVRACLVAVAALLALVSPDVGGARHAGCRPSGGETLKQVPEGRVYAFFRGSREGTWACSHRFGRSYRLDTPAVGSDAAPPFVFEGRFLASWVVACEAEGSTCGSTILVMNMAHGRVRRRAPTSNFAECADGDCRVRVARIAMKRNASVAWTVRLRGSKRTQVLRVDRRGRRLLDSGTRIVARSLRLCGRRRHVCWRAAGERRRATLY